MPDDNFIMLFCACMSRLFARIQNLENKMSSKYFHHWKSNSTMKKSTEIHSNESAKLKLRICELESQIANLSNTNDLAAALIAERVLNRYDNKRNYVSF